MAYQAARGAALVFILFVSACSSSGDDDAQQTAAGEPEASAATTPASDPATSAVAQADEATGTGVDIEALQASPPDVIAPDEEARCDRFGYPCRWTDLDDDRFDDLVVLAREIQDIVDAEPTPEEGLDAAVERLASEAVVEIIVDREGFTGMFYRLDGTPELFATTELAAPVGDPVDLDLTELNEQLDALIAAGDPAAPTGFRGGAAPRTYEPVGGPLVQKNGLVVDPYAIIDVDPADCPKGTPPDGCKKDSDNRVEGSIVYGIMSAHEQIEADYLGGANATPWALASIAGYDLVHIATHGSSGCANANEGWAGSISNPSGEDDPAGAVDARRDDFKSTTLDPDRCYSFQSLGPFDQAGFDEFRETGAEMPQHVGMNGYNWLVTDSFFLDKFQSDAIVYLSHCTSADGQLFRSGRFGSFVGWHSYARTTVAYEAGVEFWRMMVVEGVEFEIAIAHLDSRRLTWSAVLGGDGGGVAAVLGSSGKNQRARDVIEARLDGADLDGRVMRVSGAPGDGSPDRFPEGGQKLTLVVEGVKNGTADAVKLRFYADGQELVSDVNIQRDGRILEQGSEWAKWEVEVPERAIALADSSAAQYGANGTPIEIEVRASLDDAEYTADVGSVTLGARLASNGPLPIFEQLEAGMPSNGELRGNDLEIIFDTITGEATGSMRVELAASGFDLGFWELELVGTYDPASGSIEGTLEGISEGNVVGISAGESGSGTWEGIVDLGDLTLRSVLAFGGASQNYVGEVSAVGAG